MVKGAMLLPDEDESDLWDDVVLNVEGTAGVEIGPGQLFHVYTLIDVTHLSKVQLDQMALKEFSIHALLGANGKYYAAIDSAGKLWITSRENPFVDVKLMPEDAHQVASEAYIKKPALGVRRAALLATCKHANSDDTTSHNSHEMLRGLQDNYEHNVTTGARDEARCRNSAHQVGSYNGPRRVEHAVYASSAPSRLVVDQSVRRRAAAATVAVPVPASAATGVPEHQLGHVDVAVVGQQVVVAQQQVHSPVEARVQRRRRCHEVVVEPVAAVAAAHVHLDLRRGLESFRRVQVSVD